jgi:hypothetical protein
MKLQSSDIIGRVKAFVFLSESNMLGVTRCKCKPRERRLMRWIPSWRRLRRTTLCGITREVTVAVPLAPCSSWAELSESMVLILLGGFGQELIHIYSESGKSKYFRVLPLFAQILSCPHHNTNIMKKTKIYFSIMYNSLFFLKENGVLLG